jgi:hypothetical protein
MKKIHTPISLLLALALLFGASACRHESPSSAILVLGFGKHSSSTKSFAPESIVVSTIKVEGAGPGGAKVAASSQDYKPVELELAPGAWVITAKGFTDKGIEVASGFVELSVGPSERVAKDLILAPAVGEGALSLSWTLAGDATGNLTVEGALAGPGAKILPLSAAFADASGGKALRLEGLQNGSWTLTLRLHRDGVALCGLAEGILVAAGMETKATVRFTPPTATLALGFVLPDYSDLSLTVEPIVRRAARGVELAFRSSGSGNYAWYAEGKGLGVSGSQVRFTPDSGGISGSLRIDCVAEGGTVPRAGSAKAYVEKGQNLGPLVWGELVAKAEGSQAAEAAMRGLGDCRDLAWSPDGFYLVAAGKSANSLSLFEADAPGAVFASSSLGGASEPGLLAPSLLRFLSAKSILVLSESEGAACAVAVEGGALKLSTRFTDAVLAGAKDMAVTGDGNSAYIAAAVADAVSLLRLDSSGCPFSAGTVVRAGSGELGAFSRPNSLALSSDGNLVAVGTAGDDAIYLFDRDQDSGSLSLRQRVQKTDFPAASPLSDPCSLAFSADSSALFVLSYYGKSLVRLDRDVQAGSYKVTAGLKSGSGGLTGFSSPKRLALTRSNKYLLVSGSGADDGLSLFDVEGTGRLGYLGSLLSNNGNAVPSRPGPMAFSPDGAKFALGNDGSLSLFSVQAN